MYAKNLVIYDYDKILEYVFGKSNSLYTLLRDNPTDQYMLIIKSISHSDLLNSGKRNGPQESIEKNYLYYLTIDEMSEIERVRKKEFENAKQSNIGVPSDFYRFIGMPQLERREGAQTTQHEHPIVNNYAGVFLVNDTLKYFEIDYTKMVFEKLQKNPISWNYNDYKYTLTDQFTPIQLSHAIHGLGTSEDELFKKVRRSIFKSDILEILVRKNESKKEVYIMLQKNPRFYTIIGESNSTWEKYLEENNKHELYNLLRKDNLNAEEEEKTRKNQNKWRNLLAEEMMSYTTTEDEIFCPLTYISANFTNVGTLFRASHIKAFKECSVDEAFDINNGILMIANADALFDKHFITISDDGELMFSFLIRNEYKLIQELKLTEKVFKAILNDKRKEYLKRHREVFKEKEEKRKSGVYIEDDELDEDLL